MGRSKSGCNLKQHRCCSLLLGIIGENRCRFYGCKEVWVRFGTGEKTRDIPIHVLANKLGNHLSSSIILKTHVLTGCDVTSKIGT